MGMFPEPAPSTAWRAIWKHGTWVGIVIDAPDLESTAEIDTYGRFKLCFSDAHLT